ncbi:MAG TPA: FKBP-type peptidyl-prolyl cis-trans isomerase, partial [bacterium]|nr:FKBP-type peptidyl-prolyl cis-trans isomerase [bacterium]
YSIGYDVGKTFIKQEIEIDKESFIKGFKDAVEGKNSDLNDTDMKAVMTNFQMKMYEKQQLKFQAVSETNKSKGEKFREEFKTQEAVVELPSGILYKILKKGDGNIPKDTDSIVANYIGKFTDGKEFDNSYKRGEPITFVSSDVIPGWTEIFRIMPVGSKWVVVIPPELAYGERGAGGMIGPNETLVFEIELLEIK